MSSAQVRTLRGPPSDAFLDNCPVEHPAEPKSQSSADDFLILLLHYSAGDSLMVAVNFTLTVIEQLILGPLTAVKWLQWSPCVCVWPHSVL